ncbi:MAG: S-adenosylmethionine:tRNA ribosyltransferase-isomerase [Pirellulaceae bacterium]|jgi:S-adenosylmethionine:tRNA ribosyltransferase-isomerase
MSEIDQYDYHLPSELIAQQPLANRQDARLLHVDRKTQRIEHAYIRDLPEILRQGDQLVLNDTKVIPARLVGYRKLTGGKWQGLFLAVDDAGHWKIMGKTRGKLAAGEIVVLLDRNALGGIELQLIANMGDGVWVAKPISDRSHLEILDELGRVPLPPYIRGGEMQDEDVATYQTVFAKHPGAVAAPTAGLHFTKSILGRLEAVGVKQHHVTLHVGAGTFRPISVEALDEHQMHSEWACVSAETAGELQQGRDAGKRVVAVGTTSVRTLETAAAGSLDGTLAEYEGETNLFIRPPYTFKAVDALLTNFHLPKSTLLVLVRCFGGDDLIRRAYQEAIEEAYRFYSYGDAMFIE